MEDASDASDATGEDGGEIEDGEEEEKSYLGNLSKQGTTKF